MSPTGSRRYLSRVVTLVGAALFTLAACTGSDNQPAYNTVLPSATSILPSSTTIAGATTTTGVPVQTLLGICPSPVVVQLDGNLDMWATPYAALTSDVGVSDGLRYRAQFLDPITRQPLGIDIELRTIGALPAGTTVESAVLGDTSILLGATTVNDVFPTTTLRPILVAAPWTEGDLALRWTLNSASSSALTIGDLAGTVLANPDVNLPAAGYLQASGLLPRKRDVGVVRPEAKTAGTTGSATLIHILDDPAQLVPLVEGSGLERAQLLAEVGWEPYPHALVTRPDGVEARLDCLGAIIPLIQKAVLRTSRQPRTLTERLATIAKQMGTSFAVTRSVQQLQAAISLGLLGVGNESDKISANISQGRFTQIAKAQVLSSRILKPRLTLPKDLDKITARRLDRRFLDSSVTFDADVSDLIPDA